MKGLDYFTIYCNVAKDYSANMRNLLVAFLVIIYVFGKNGSAIGENPRKTIVFLLVASKTNALSILVL